MMRPVDEYLIGLRKIVDQGAIHVEQVRLRDVRLREDLDRAQQVARAGLAQNNGLRVEVIGKVSSARDALTQVGLAGWFSAALAPVAPTTSDAFDPVGALHGVRSAASDFSTELAAYVADSATTQRVKPVPGTPPPPYRPPPLPLARPAMRGRELLVTMLVLVAVGVLITVGSAISDNYSSGADSEYIPEVLEPDHVRSSVQGTVKVQGRTLTVRSTTSDTEGKALGKLRRNEKVTVYCYLLGSGVQAIDGIDNNNWDQIKFRGVVGYVADALVDTGGDIESQVKQCAP